MNQRNNDDGPRRPGQVKEITSLANPIIKDIKALSEKKNRERSGTFMAEGLKLVLDAIETGWQIDTLMYAKSGIGKPLIEKAALHTVATGGLVLEVTEKVLSSVTRRDNPQMVVGIFHTRWHNLVDIKPKPGETFVALDRVRDPGNLGTIIRTADAAGASGVILVGETTDPFSLETVRATMGSVFSMPLIRTGVAEFLQWQKTSGTTMVATHLKGAIDYRKADYKTRPVVLLMGNEQAGLPDELAAAAGTKVRIPQQGRADSLNLAIATAVMLFEARRHLLDLAGIDD
jgi:TrmH family RNA methyltransferase